MAVGRGASGSPWRPEGRPGTVSPEAPSTLLAIGSLRWSLVRIAYSASLVLLAAPVAVAALAAWPSGGAAGQVAAFSTAALLVSALVVAGVTVWRTTLDVPARSLVTLLASGVLLLEATVLPLVVEPWMHGDLLFGSGAGPISALTWLVIGGATVTTSAALLRFSLFFPEPLRDEDVVVLLSQGVQDESRVLRGIWKYSNWAAERWPWTLKAANVLRRLGRSRYLALFTAAAALPALYGFSGFLATGAVAVVLLSAGQSNLVNGYSLADRDGRLKTLWVLIGLVPVGVVLGTLASFLLGYVTAAIGAGDWTALLGRLAALDHGARWMRSLFLLGPFGLLVLCLALAIFRSGALDATLVIRRTAVYGLLGGLLLFLFAGLEEVISDALLARLGLPQGLGTWLAAGTAALAFRPVKGLLERSVGASIAGRFAWARPFGDEGAEGYVLSMDMDPGPSGGAAALRLFRRAVHKVANRLGGSVRQDVPRVAMVRFDAFEPALSAATGVLDTVSVASDLLEAPAGELRFGIAPASQDVEEAGALAKRLSGAAGAGEILVAGAPSTWTGPPQLEEAPSSRQPGEGWAHGPVHRVVTRSTSDSAAA